MRWLIFTPANVVYGLGIGIVLNLLGFSLLGDPLGYLLWSFVLSSIGALAMTLSSC